MTRRSAGGHVVEASLRAAGLLAPPAGIALVETAPPRAAPYRLVLAQNAWTVIDSHAMVRHAAPYPGRERRRHHARRAVAALNLRRAGTVVTLSRAMADLVSARGVAAEVCPVTLPMDVCVPEGPPRRPAWVPEGRRLLVVPGTVTPYKGTGVLATALTRADRTRLADLVVVLAGADDRTGYLEAVRDDVRRAAGVPVLQGQVDRHEMRWLLSSSTAVLLPSRLESLGLGLAEALALAGHVVASPIPAHREVAGRVGREPLWLGDAATLDALATQLASGFATPVTPPDPTGFVAEWHALAARLTG